MPGVKRAMISRFRFLAGGCAGFVLISLSLYGQTARRLKDFEGVEEPVIRYVAATRQFVPDSFVNITESGAGTVRMTLRYGRDGWDGDRNNHDTSRQRAEVKGIGPHQRTGETFEYGTTWRTDPAFHGTGKFCHVFQLKATDGDKAPPLVVLSVLEGTGNCAVRYWSGDTSGFRTARQFKWTPNVWQTVRIRIHTSNRADGSVLVSVDGDAFQGATNVAVFRPDADAYRPKWGLYRGITPDLPVGLSWVEHRDACARKL